MLIGGSECSFATTSDGRSESSGIGTSTIGPPSPAGVPPAVSGKLRLVTTKLYTLLGWFAWQGISILAKRKLGQNKVKLGAAATVAAVLVGGALAAKAASDES